MLPLETPSRIWRRMEDLSGKEMPSLPSLPAFGEDDEYEREPSSEEPSDDASDHHHPVHSTPAPSSHHTSTTRHTSSSSSASRFANSIARSSMGGRSSTRGMTQHPDSFDEVSAIPSLPDIEHGTGDFSEEEEIGLYRRSRDSVPDEHLPPDVDDGDDDFSVADALESVSRAGSPHISRKSEATPKKNYDYSVSLRSEPKACVPSPIDKYRNVALRRAAPRARTPPLSRTTPSPLSSPANSTPRSNRSAATQRSSAESPLLGASIPLPRSATASPAIVISRPESEEDSFLQEGNTHSMDITDVHVSPVRTVEPEESEEEDKESLPHQEEASDEHEPTFSSEGDGAPTFRRSPGALSNALSSPAQSIAFTPTPAFPRPRARFGAIPTSRSPDDDVLATPVPQQVAADDHDDLLTPATRRRSFYMDLVTSTARPRLKQAPTPHPRARGRVPSTEDETVEMETPGPGHRFAALGTAEVGLRTAFAGATPRLPPVGRRNSHPLAQTYIPSPGTSDSESRANASFDPAMGFTGGKGGMGVGRFNAGKLNTYLHGLNRRLQEENEGLVERVRRAEALVKEQDRLLNADGGGKGRRVSLGGTMLGDVEEDVAAEGWTEEKAELEEMIDSFKEQVASCTAEKEEAEKALQEERRERERDKERWKARMGEVEKGVEVIVGDLDVKLQLAEKRAEAAESQVKDAEKMLEEVEAKCEEAVERAEKAERVLESGKELGGELREANERVGKVLAELRTANSQIKELQEQVAQSDARAEELTKELEEERALAETLENELDAKVNEATAHHQGIQKLEEELQLTKDYVAELEQAGEEAGTRLEALEEQVVSAQAEIKHLKIVEEQVAEQVEGSEEAKDGAEELARQMEEALEAAEGKMLEDEEEIAQLKGRLNTLERERERQQEKSQSSNEVSVGRLAPGPTEAEMEALEEELDEAHKEIARLTTLLNHSPVRKAIENAKDSRIDMLEKEREDLLERNKALRTVVNEMGTPNKSFNVSGISSIHRQVLSVSIRAPRTPGGPLRDMSWLNATGADGTVAPLLSEIARLQLELDRANESIDDKLDKLEDAGLGVVGLTKRLEDARARIVALEEEIARLSRKEQRRDQRLERARCQKCLAKVDLRSVIRADADESFVDTFNASLPSEPPTPPTRTTEALRTDLHTVNSQLAKMKRQWEEEKQQLLGENAILQDKTNRLDAKVRTAEEEVRKVAESKKAGEKLRVGVEGELDEAKRVILELESDLKAERVRLRTFATEQNRVQRDKENVLVQLQRTEADMEDVKTHLQRFKQENHALEAELRVNANAEQKARLLEVRVSENAETVEQLRQERSLLAMDHKDLQRRFTEISEQANRLRTEYRTSQNSHDKRRHELDLRLGEIGDLRRALDDQADQLQQTEAEKERIAAEKNGVASTVATLEADLRRVRRDAEAFGRDLKLLRAEKDRLEAKQSDDATRAERMRKQNQSQIRVLTEQLDGQRSKTVRLKEELKSHVCVMDERQLSALKLQHNKECKGLIVQIRYLKAKFTRESSFRNDLCYQKDYLLVLLSQFEKSERNIIASIARIGFPAPSAPPSRKPNKLKAAALTVIFLSRAKRASDSWREQSASKQAVVAALEEVRRRRVITA
ncbi:hypothetical protein FB45DRAFT_987061 [Roridomyces roridus]|uniref:Pericentrin/AKAP-450 centrosomal targeting domain-containing protein n=1 Tax=Roridomyces roridus TaxID=1738132 RepID=A0AAD7G011_9AGAR|nr:hypothetical protein FB45DRAFT_987061 [Roridomyces roridus]